MSTFNGIVEEFPQIRIDYFRKSPENPPPLACFLSHVHSDHLQGLESLRAPFVYCSAATREILLRIEKYPHRMNFSKGILESRKQHYKHLAKLLRPLPLHVPTEIELMPRCHIRVTLFDANHCPGAVMFLIEGNGKAVLYTGDIRAEPWWVNSITRNPVLIPYTVGKKRLDRIYLDTTFAIKSDIYRTFPSKAEGIRELLEALQRYPEDTTFYLRAWTFGYEDVWLALSAALNTQVHVDRYQMGLYKSLAKGSNNGLAIDEAPFLCGFTLGNSHIPGCLTDDQSSRIHSCEPGMLCAKISKSPSVFITPIVTRTSEGVEVAEVGAGGGKGDLYQSHDLELSDEATLQQLAAFCAEQIQDEAARSMAVAALFEAYKSKSKTLSLNEYGIKEEDEISIREFVNLLARDGRNVEGTVKDIFPESTASRVRKTGKTNNSLSQTVTFPYSRHSSYAELCGLVEAFKPKDIYPCTVDVETWNEDVSIRTLFGHLCSGTEFSHDNDMQELLQSDEYRPRKRMRRASDSSSIALSTQRSALEIISVEHSDSLTHLVEAETRTSPSEVPLETASQVQAENRREASNPSASQYQNVDTSSQSTNPRISAVKAALKQKRQDNELDFYLPSSFSSEFDSQGTSQLSISSKPKGPEDEGHEPDSIGYMSSNQLHGEPQRGGSSQTTNVDEHPDTQPDDDIESTLTLSPSAFDSQHSTVEQQQRTTRDPNDANNSNAAPTLISISSSASSDSLPALAQPPASSSLQRRDSRMAAYRAARSGSYEAWSSFCTPVSAGNNHTEEDVEL